eukprot:753784-Hanusia_phi.AAC.7
MRKHSDKGASSHSEHDSRRTGGQNKNSAGAGGTKAKQTDESLITRQLKAQLRALSLLQRDLPVPLPLLAEAQGTSAPPFSTRDQRPLHPLSFEGVLTSTLKLFHDRTQLNVDSKVFPLDTCNRPSIEFLKQIASKSKSHVEQHMKAREDMLAKTPTANMPLHVAERVEREKVMLKLYNLQQEIRECLLSCHVDKAIPSYEHMSVLHKYDKKANITQEEYEKQWEATRKQYEDRFHVNRRKLFLDDMSRTQRDFLAFHNNVKRLREQICKGVRQWHKNAEKVRDKEKLDRLAALKANDFDRYREFVKSAKNERLNELISKTDIYLSVLANKMSRASKNLAGGASDQSAGALLELDHQILPSNAEDENESESTKDTQEGQEEADSGKKNPQVNGEEQVSTKSVEQALQHVVKEVVFEQPSIMGGPELKLKPYQIQGVQWLVSLYNNNLSGILADEMGLGKTIQVIGLLTYIIESKGDNGPFMIIAPLSTITNWAIEFSRWAPSLEVIVYKGNKDVRRNLFRSKMKSGGFQVLIVQYEMAMKTEDMRNLKTFTWSYIIVDEGHRLKNKDSKLFIVLSKEYTSKRKLILTGTPLQNNITELWNLLNFLLPHVFDTDQDFKTWFSKPFAISNDDEEEQEASLEEQMVLINRLHQVLRPFMLRRVKTDKDLQLSMPENREVIIKCSLSGLQSIMYRQLQHAVLRSRDDKGNVTAKAYNNIIVRLRQVCNHPYLLDEQWDLGQENLVRVCGKFDVLDRILPKLKAAGHRVLIYSQMVRLLEILETYVKEKDYVYNKLVGATASDERAFLIEEFNKQDSEIFIFLLSTRAGVLMGPFVSWLDVMAGGQGVNLQTADTVIIFDSDWNPMMDEQVSPPRLSSWFDLLHRRKRGSTASDKRNRSGFGPIRQGCDAHDLTSI